jgi:hypothetical protein
MLKHIVTIGLIVHEGETIEQAEEKQRKRVARNAQMDALLADWEKQRRRPMASMKAWAVARGLWI